MKVLIDLPTIQADSLVLNSVSFFEKSRERMEQYSYQIFIYSWTVTEWVSSAPSRLSNGLQNTRIKVDIITVSKT